jgi:streptogramin lyase
MIASTPVAVNSYKINEYSTPSGGAGPWFITSGPDGNLWFTENWLDKVAKITTSGTITEYPAAGGSGPIAITAGADGRLWFTENTKIARINTDGTGYTEYAAAGGATPKGIISGPDGNLWFIDRANNSIGVMSTAGVLLHNYTAGITAGALGSAFPFHLVVGPDNNVWFSEYALHQFGRITTTGVVSEFFVAGDAGWTTVGSDGNLWSTTSSGTNVKVINMSETITQTYGYPGDAVPATARFNDITLGNDGKVWMTDWANSVIYNMSTGDAVNLYTTGISGGANETGIVVGPDGNLWFCEQVTSKIGKLTY